MINDFARTMRSLEAERGGPQLVAVGLLLLAIAGWVTWLMLARMEVHAVSDQARIQVATTAHVARFEASGRVSRVLVDVGQRVEAGEVLAELDTQAQELDLVQLRAEIELQRARAGALQRQIDALKEAEAESRRASTLSTHVAKARRREAEAALEVAEEEHARISQLVEAGAASELERLRLRGEQGKQRAQVDALRLELERLRVIGDAVELERVALRAQVDAELVTALGLVARGEAAVRKLEHLISRQHVRAAVPGRIGELSPLGRGAYVEAGEQLGTIIPEGELAVVAYFGPAEASGRIEAGQPAVLRLDGFPWTSFGVVRGHVVEVASEARDERVRVEIAIDSMPESIPATHGLPGEVEVEVERVSPAALFLRAAGRLLGGEAEG